MAVIKLSDIISDIRGRVGTHIYSVWKGKHTVRMEPKNFAYPWVSPFNAKHRSLIDACGSVWRYVLTLEQRQAWELFAEYLGTLTGLYGEGAVERIPGLRRYGGAMSGFNAFTLINDLRWSVGKTDILGDAPLSGIFPPQPIFTVLEFVSNGAISLRATFTNPGALPRTTYARAWCRGIKYAHLLIGDWLEIATPWQLTWDKMHYTKGAVSDLLPDTYQVQLDFITEDGLFSPPSDIKSLILVPPLTGGVWDETNWNYYAWGG